MHKHPRPFDQPQVTHVTQIVVVRVRRQEQLARDHRLDHPPHPVLAQPGGQRVQMRRTRQDQPLLRLLHVLGRDRPVRRHPHLLDDLPGQRVDQPRLSLGKAEGTLQRIHREILARLRGVLPVQLGDLGRGEVAQPQRRHLDVERTPTGSL
ncbi:hypothetical protein [Streptomyces sp. bgisy027]|uniref:hypothetical protein n=1 Tax=Streptomyces sp. bgisy027 TaxID=3413770 RepID=UPI003D760E62